MLPQSTLRLRLGKGSKKAGPSVYWRVLPSACRKTCWCNQAREVFWFANLLPEPSLCTACNAYCASPSHRRTHAQSSLFADGTALCIPPSPHSSARHDARLFSHTWHFQYTFLWNNAAHGTPGRSHHQSIRHTHTPARDGRSLCFWGGYNKWKERVFSAFFTSIFITLSLSLREKGHLSVTFFDRLRALRLLEGPAFTGFLFLF